MRVKRAIVGALDKTCGWFDSRPPWKRKRIIGCGGYLPLAEWSIALENRWHTAYRTEDMD